MKLAYAFPAIAVLLQAPAISRASDHLDGVKTAIDYSADLTDLFTFTSPSDPSKLVLVMNSHSLANSYTRFSNAIDYKFRIRAVDATTLVPDAAHESTLTCSFTGSLLSLSLAQHATCTLRGDAGNAEVQFDTRNDAYRAGGEGEQNGLHAFAGVRSDPWFLDLKRAIDFNNGKLADGTPGSNGLKGKNVLSIVVEVPKDKLPGTLLAVTSQTVRR